MAFIVVVACNRGLLDYFIHVSFGLGDYCLHHNRRVLFNHSIDCDFCCLKL
jgi:hypothetical protein